MAYQQADLVKIGEDGFALIDMIYGPAKKYGTVAPTAHAYADLVYQGRDNPRRKEVISRSNTQNMVTQSYRAIYREAKYY